MDMTVASLNLNRRAIMPCWLLPIGLYSIYVGAEVLADSLQVYSLVLGELAYLEK